MKSANILLSSAILVSALALAPTEAALAAAQPHDHAHESTSKLTLDHGKRWATDAPLREGMARIRGTVEPQLERVHARKLDRAAYDHMAGGIETQLAYIVGNCKLSPEADAVLHAIIARIGDGIETMKSGTESERGVKQVVAALNEYGQYFDHPGWKPVRAGR